MLAVAGGACPPCVRCRKVWGLSREPHWLTWGNKKEMDHLAVRYFYFSSSVVKRCSAWMSISISPCKSSNYSDYMKCFLYGKKIEGKKKSMACFQGGAVVKTHPHSTKKSSMLAFPWCILCQAVMPIQALVFRVPGFLPSRGWQVGSSSVAPG